MEEQLTCFSNHCVVDMFQCILLAHLVSSFNPHSTYQLAIVTQLFHVNRKCGTENLGNLLGSSRTGLGLCLYLDCGGAVTDLRPVKQAPSLLGAMWVGRAAPAVDLGRLPHGRNTNKNFKGRVASFPAEQVNGKNLTIGTKNVALRSWLLQ